MIITSKMVKRPPLYWQTKRTAWRTGRRITKTSALNTMDMTLLLLTSDSKMAPMSFRILRKGKFSLSTRFLFFS